MDRIKFSSIAHRRHSFCSPVDPARFDEIAALARLQAGSRVLDIGCGKAEALIRLAERYGVISEGVDSSGPFIEEARERAQGRIPESRLVLHAMEAEAFTAPSGAYQLAMSIGATHAWGGYEATLDKLAACVPSGGYILVGEAYWKRAPDPSFLELLGAKVEELRTHDGNFYAGLARGLTFLYASTSSEADWDRYEGLYCYSIEAYARENPGDSEAQEYLTRGRKVRDRYYRGGRDTLGFGLYLFLKP